MSNNGKDPKVSTRTRRALNRLVDSKVALVTDVRSKHRGKEQGHRENYYYIDKARGGQALLMGAFVAGVEDERVAKSNWKLHQLPARAEHANVRTDYLILLMQDALSENKRRGVPWVSVPLDEAYGESHPDFPLFGVRKETDPDGSPTGQKGAKPIERIIPDARFIADWNGVGQQKYDLEVELWTRTRAVAQKLDKRAAWMQRLYDQRVAEWVAPRLADWKTSGAAGAPDSAAVESKRKTTVAAAPFVGLPPEAAIPVIFLFRSGDVARAMRDRLWEMVDGGDPLLRRYAAFKRRLLERKSALGRLILFAGWDELNTPVVAETQRMLTTGEVEQTPETVSGGRTLAELYTPLTSYPEQGGGNNINLRTVAAYAQHLRNPKDGSQG